MVRDRGFEPLTPSVSRKCSTTELTAPPADAPSATPATSGKVQSAPHGVVHCLRHGFWGTLRAMTQKIRRALLSVSDKSGLESLARTLADAGVDLISTGGTARALR